MAALSCQRRLGKRRCKQDDAEIGVVAYAASRRLDRKPDASSDGESGLANDRRRRFRAFLEICDGHAMAVAVPVHIARLQRIELGKAGLTEALRDDV